jgi:hypothetical protein
MRELNLYQTEKDELHLIKAAIAAGCKLVADSNFETPEAPVISTVAAFQTSRAEQRHFFILHESFQRLPITFRQVAKNGKQLYYVSPSQGGPFLEFLGGGIFVNDKTGTKYVRSGFLAYRPEYWDEGLAKKWPAPPELSETYGKLSKVIRVKSTQIKPDKTVYWLGDDAKAQLLNGVKLALHDQWSFPAP